MTRKFDLEKHLAQEHHNLGHGTMLRDFILGGQDGVVNVLGILLGVAAATLDNRIVIIAGLAATFAESISMAAVAYTSTKAETDFYYGEYHKEKTEIEKKSPTEVAEVREVYRRKGFSGKLLEQIVKKISSNKKIMLDFMMTEELNLGKPNRNPLTSAILVGFSAIVGSFIPLVGFFFLPPQQAMVFAVAVSAAVLFVAGAIKAKLTIGSWWKTGAEMMLVGMAAALVGYAVGALFGASGG
ncbi:MAG: VIT1/CCC1 transporter family protein [Candidatus Micrarchaeota archaeon]